EGQDKNRHGRNKKGHFLRKLLAPPDFCFPKAPAADRDHRQHEWHQDPKVAEPKIPPMGDRREDSKIERSKKWMGKIAIVLHPAGLPCQYRAGMKMVGKRP